MWEQKTKKQLFLKPIEIQQKKKDISGPPRSNSGSGQAMQVGPMYTQEEHDTHVNQRPDGIFRCTTWSPVRRTKTFLGISKREDLIKITGETGVRKLKEEKMRH